MTHRRYKWCIRLRLELQVGSLCVKPFTISVNIIISNRIINIINIIDNISALKTDSTFNQSITKLREKVLAK